MCPALPAEVTNAAASGGIAARVSRCIAALSGSCSLAGELPYLFPSNHQFSKLALAKPLDLVGHRSYRYQGCVVAASQALCWLATVISH